MEDLLDPEWRNILRNEFCKPYFEILECRVENAYKTAPVYPPRARLFSAFTLCPFDSLKVVILGQDPYHGHGQAHGLAFSVMDGVKFPPSLNNIFKELSSDIGTPPPISGNLERWAMQGVLLLNTTLTVEEAKPASHQRFGWEEFTDAVISTISKEREHIVFILWGNHARTKKSLIDTVKHLVLEAPHPSPLSAYVGFLGCKHFSKANEYLQLHGKQKIAW